MTPMATAIVIAVVIALLVAIPGILFQLGGFYWLSKNHFGRINTAMEKTDGRMLAMEKDIVFIKSKLKVRD